MFNQNSLQAQCCRTVGGFVFLATVLLPCIGVSSETSGSNEKLGALALVWMDPAGLVPMGIQRTEKEALSILEEAGIAVTWRAYNQVEDLTPRPDERGTLQIMLTSKDSSIWGLDRNVMGAVVGKDEGRRVFIFFPNIKRALGYQPQEKVKSSPQRIHQFAKALGRIIAHEVVHVCYPELEHTEDGLMHARWNLKNLEYRKPKHSP